jgi:hypothetical protein
MRESLQQKNNSRTYNTEGRMKRKNKYWVMDDTYSDSITSASQCMHCKILKVDGKCKAYPNAIPLDIWTAKRKDCNRFTPLRSN